MFFATQPDGCSYDGAQRRAQHEIHRQGELMFNTHVTASASRLGSLDHSEKCNKRHGPGYVTGAPSKDCSRLR